MPNKNDSQQTTLDTLAQTGGNEPWRKWTVKPELKHMPTTPPESGIGQRIAYCRGQMENLSVEALARYTKFFDEAGIARATIVRYESGDNTPGGRELRILCDALWVPANWLLFGQLDNTESRPEAAALLDAFDAYIDKRTGHEGRSILERRVLQSREQYAIEERQQWIHEARQPKPRA